ncbi:peptidylprolyl isomerase [Porphyromonas cangingivalis]|uniref:Periplasmic chaperone for outer membrane proteins SurA n=1 Tax=Porphyromonas cangingivalis TaxID=36874 RepID=A0A1T4KPL7_PORCN|nr:peptidylprolyl isomerase [Porphyromonas cangingivalis]SJZ44334.1 periplasmic chaperone for outer membrane proteins SurA [Porphyromonas cangingivalis]VEJ02499.1 Peptidyl-prolyl cis-trans isomerase surA [Porphyromonas cangingivalis]
MKHNYIKIFALLVCSFMVGVSSFAQKKNVIDQVAWIVGDEPILLSDIEKQRIYYEAEGQKFDLNARCVISERLAIQKLFLNQAKIDSIQPNELAISQEVNSRIEKAIKDIGSVENLESYLGKSVSQFREELRKIMREEFTVQQVQHKLVADIKLSPSEVTRFYNEIEKDSLPFVPTTVETQIITVAPKISPKEIDDIKARLRDFSNEISAGTKSFSTLARLYSQDNATALSGGDMGFVSKAELEPEFAHVAFGLGNNTKVSRIVKTAKGYHIMQLIEKRGDRINLRHIMLKPEVSDENIQKAQAQLDSIVGLIRADSVSFEVAANYVSHDEDTRNSNGQMVNLYASGASPLYGTSKFEMGHLPQEIAAKVVNLREGEISAPFIMKDKNNNTVVAVVKLKRRIDGHRANITEDYQTVKEIVLNKKRAEVIDKWIKQKQKETFVKISPEYQQCQFNYPGWIKR